MPKLKLVENAGGPPRPLSEHGMALWRSITHEFDITDAAGVELLCLACQALDRAEECRALIGEHGVALICSPGSIRANPLVKIELEHRAFVSKTLERLGLNSEAPKAVGRPPAGSWSHEKTAIESAQDRRQ